MRMSPSQRKAPKHKRLGVLAPPENNENIFARVASFYGMQQKRLVEDGRNVRGHKVSTR